MQLRFAIEIAEQATTLGARHACDRIHKHAPHRGEIDHQSAVANREAGDVVPAALHRERQALRPRKIHAGDDVADADAARDERGPPIDHAVPDRARFVIARLAGSEKGSAQLRLQFGAQGRRRRCHACSS